MFNGYVIKAIKTLWGTINNIGTTVPGDLHYGRKVGSGTPYGRFTLSTVKIEHVSDSVRHATYNLQVEIYSENSADSDLLGIANALDSEATATSSLLAVLKAAVETAVSSGPGTPGGKWLYPWRSAPGSESLQTEEERRSGRDVHVTRWACRLRIQWP